MGYLTLKYRFHAAYDPDDPDPQYLHLEQEGRLTVTVVTGQFSGSVDCDDSSESVRAFGESLSTYPIEIDKPLAASWGQYRRLARVVIRAVNATGTLLVSVDLEDGDFLMDYGGGAEGVRVAFTVGYPRIDAFRRSIANMMDGRIDEAVLGRSDAD